MYRILLLILPIALLSCNNSVDHYVLKVRLRHLDESNMYNKDLVKDILFDAEELDKDSLKTKSHELFLKGIDLVKNKNQVQEGISLLKRSILVFPDSKCYYELGNALAEVGAKKELEEALLSYDVANELKYQPLSYIYVRKAAVSNMLSQLSDEGSEMYQEDVIYYLTEAFRTGLNDTSVVSKDARLRNVISGPEYKKLLVRAAMLNTGTGPSGLLKLFVESFPGPVSEFEILKENAGNTKDAISVNYEFASYIPEMENASFGRDVTRDFFYVTRLKTNEKYNAVIYSSVSFMGEEMQPVYTTLATIDNSGKTISRKLISCQCSAEKIRTVSYKDNQLVLTDYKRNWEHPITEVSFEENRIKGYEKLSEATFMITETGEIVNDKVPGDFKDPSEVAIK